MTSFEAGMYLVDRAPIQPARTPIELVVAMKLTSL